MPLFAPPTKVQGSFPGATVAVYLAGTTTTATIYSDNLGTLKGNPFTAQADGHWDFWTQGLVDVQFSGGGLANPFTLYAMGSTAANVFGKQFVNVVDFGAKGDGTADDTAAIQAAVNSLSTIGGTVFLPCGNYKISGPIQFWHNDPTNKNIPINFEGAGRDCTILYNPTQTDGIQPTSYSRISNMTLRGADYPQVNPVLGTGIGIDSGGSNPTNGPSFVILEDLIIEYWPGDNINSGGWSNWWTVHNVVSRYSGNESMLVTGQSNYWNVSNYTAYGCRYNGLDISGVGHNFSNIDIYQCGGIGPSSGDQDGFLIAADSLTPTTSDITVTNCRLFQNNTHGLRFQCAQAGSTIKRIRITNLTSVQNGQGNGGAHDGVNAFGDGVVLIVNGPNTLIQDVNITNVICDGNTRWGFTLDAELATSLIDRVQLLGISAINHNGYTGSPGQSFGVAFGPFFQNIITHVKVQGFAFNNQVNLHYQSSLIPEDQIEFNLWTDDPGQGTMTNIPGQNVGWILNSSGNTELTWHTTQASNRDWKLFQSQFGNFSLLDVVGNQEIWRAPGGPDFVFLVSPRVALAGNPQIELKDTISGHTGDYAWFVDQNANMGFNDVYHNAVRFSINTNGAVWVRQNLAIGPNFLTNGYAINDFVLGGHTLTWTAVPNGQTQDQTFTLNTSTVADGSPCSVSIPAGSYGTNTLYSCFMDGPNTIAVRLTNLTGAPLTLTAFARVILWGF